MPLQNTGLLRSHSTEFSSAIRLLDALIIWASSRGIGILFEIQHQNIYDYAAMLGIIFYFFIAEIRHLYRSSRLESYSDIVYKIITTWGMVSIALILTAFITKSSATYSRLIIIGWLVATPLLLAFEHFCIYLALRRLRSAGKNIRSFAILGDPESEAKLLGKINAQPWTGLAHFCSYQKLDDLLKDALNTHIDYVFLTYPDSQKNKIIQAVNALGNTTSTVYLAPNIFLSDLLGSKWVTLGNMPMITINDHPFYGTSLALKKIEDGLLGAVIFVCILPILLAIAITIKLTSPGPALFKQRRYGLNGEIIWVYKFRTMSTQDDGTHITQATKDDERITPLGKFLRRTSLDELPQFINVLQGTMSIVGPRPHAISHNEHYRNLVNGYMLRHKVKPGITGWAQVNGLRGETDTLDKMQSRIEFDLYYINHWSIWFDLKIILMTIFGGFSGKTAY